MDRSRYIVVEHTGFPIRSGVPGGGSSLQTEVMVLDRAYCHKVVWSSVSSVMERSKRSRITGKIKRWSASASQWPLARRRAYAADLAARLDAP